MVQGRGIAGLERLLDQHIDHGAIFGVHHHQCTVACTLLERAENLSVVREKDTLVGHEEFETRHAFLDEFVHGGERSILHVAQNLVETVVDRAVARGLLVPEPVLVEDVLVRVLHDEVDDARRSAVGRSPRSRLEGV